jgi:hypothetical protein
LQRLLGHFDELALLIGGGFEGLDAGVDEGHGEFLFKNGGKVHGAALGTAPTKRILVAPQHLVD